MCPTAIERWQMAHFDDFNAEFLRLLALMAIHRANADLDQALGRAFFHDASKRAGMRVSVAFQFVVQIRVCIEMDDGQSRHALAEG